MKRLNTLMFFLLIVLLASACRKDEITNDEDIIIINTNEDGEVGLQGHVTDVSKRSLAGAQVTVGDQTVFTDDYGFFVMDDADVLNGNVTLTIRKEDYITQFKKILVSDAQEFSFVRSSLISEEGHSSFFEASQGGSLFGNAEHSVTFEPNSIMTEAGENYDSTVLFTSYYVDPSRADLGEVMSGDLSAINSQGEEVQLISFGMLYGELFAPNGTPLQIKEGHTATIEIPIPSNAINQAPEQIPLWSLNEETATWIEDGVAVKQGNRYVGKVSHFSFWNCDAPYPIVRANGCITNQDGVPLSNTTIFVTVPELGVTRYCTTDREGCFYGKFPLGEDMLIGVYNDCGEDTFIPFGPFTSDTEIGTLVFDISQFAVLIDGKLENCSFQPVFPGIVEVVKDDNQVILIPTNEAGIFSHSHFTCGGEKINVRGIDPLALVESETSQYELIDFVNVGTLSACGQEIPEFVKFTFDGSLNLFTNIMANRVGNRLLLNGSNLDYSFNLEIEETDIATPLKSLLVLNADGSPFLLWEEDSNGTINFNFIEAGGLGEEVSGSFNGEHLGVELLCEYKLDIDNELTAISGRVWNDENQNGIRESGELPMEGVRIDIDEPSTNINTQTITDANGMYTLYGTHLNANQLTITLPDDYYLTDVGQGTNFSVDSDFDQDSGIASVAISGPGLEVQNIDAGIHIAGSTYCDITTVSDPCDTGDGDICQEVSSAISGLNFSNVILESGGMVIFETGPATSTVQLCGLSYGTYRIIAIMENGVECVHNITLSGQPIDEMLFQLSFLSCDPLEAIVTAIPEKLESSELDYEWSNGIVDQTTMMTEGETLSLTSTNVFGCDYTYDYTLEKRNLLISGVAWIEVDGGIENVRDSNDTGRFGSLWFSLHSVDGTKIDEFKTGNSGIYQFYLDVPPGEYYIMVGDFSSLYELVTPFQGTDDTRDSDFDQSSKRSNVFTVTGDDCQSIQNLDVGITLI